jgi:hypothetical protein
MERVREERDAIWVEALLPDGRYAQFEIIPNYMPPYPDRDTKPSVVIRHKPCGNFLRHSGGPRTGSFWDLYGDDFLTVELATVELSKAPPCPFSRSDTRAIAEARRPLLDLLREVAKRDEIFQGPVKYAGLAGRIHDALATQDGERCSKCGQPQGAHFFEMDSKLGHCAGCGKAMQFADGICFECNGGRDPGA